MEANQFHRRAIPTRIGENPYADPYALSVFGVRKRLRYLRAVRLKPDSNDFRMRPYALYAVPLKGKRPKRLQLPKEVHEVHTAAYELNDVMKV